MGGSEHMFWAVLEQKVCTSLLQRPGSGQHVAVCFQALPLSGQTTSDTVWQWPQQQLSWTRLAGTTQTSSIFSLKQVPRWWTSCISQLGITLGFLKLSGEGGSREREWCLTDRMVDGLYFIWSWKWRGLILCSLTFIVSPHKEKSCANGFHWWILPDIRKQHQSFSNTSNKSKRRQYFLTHPIEAALPWYRS